MKLIPILASAAIAFAFPACSTMSKKESCPPKGSSCCAAKAKCDVPGKKPHQ